PDACDASATFGLIINVVDAEGVAVCDPTVTVRAEEDGFSEELRYHAPNCVWSGVPERAGTYEVTASNGHDVASVSDLRVMSDECHVIPRRGTLTLSAGDA